MLLTNYAGICAGMALYAFCIASVVFLINPKCSSHFICFLTSSFGGVAAIAMGYMISGNRDSLFEYTYIWCLFLSNITHSFVPVVRIWNLCKQKHHFLFYMCFVMCMFSGAFTSAYTTIIYDELDSFVVLNKAPLFQIVFFSLLVLVNMICVYIVLREFTLSEIPQISQNLKFFEKISILSLFVVIIIGSGQLSSVLELFGDGNFSIFTHILALTCSISQGFFELNRQYSLHNLNVDFIEF